MLIFNLLLLLFAINTAYYFYHRKRAIPGMLPSFIESYPQMTREDVKQLLFESDSRPFVYEPFTEFAEGPIRGKFVNVDPRGFRWVKNQGPWPIDNKNINVFFFGGSTAFGYGVPDDATIPSQLQEQLNKGNSGPRIFVYNFGRGFYDSTFERILYAQLLAAGHTPDVAIFLDGLNDSKWKGDSGSRMTHRISRIINHPFRAVFFEAWEQIKALPISELARRLILRVASPRPQPQVTARDVLQKKFKLNSEMFYAVRRWKYNRHMIDAIGREFNIKVVFIWQPVPSYKYDRSHHGFWLHGRNYIRPIYQFMAENRSALEKYGNFLWLADMAEHRKERLYVDAFHYNPAFSADIAKEIASYLTGHRLVVKSRGRNKI